MLVFYYDDDASPETYGLNIRGVFDFGIFFFVYADTRRWTTIVTTSVGVWCEARTDQPNDSSG